MTLADTAQLIVQLGLDDKLSPGLNRVSGSLNKLDAAGQQIGRGISQVGRGAFKVAERGAIAFGAGVLGAIKVAGDFEAQLNTINTIAKTNSAGLTQIGSGIRQTFTETGVSLDELTSAYYDLLSAGVKVTDAQSVLNTAVKLGVGGLATTKESVDLLTTAMNSYGLSVDGTAKASDIFAAAVRDGKLTISDLSGSFADVAPLAAQAGVKLEELGAAYATLTARGVPAAEVGTQINRGIIELLKPGPELIKVMKGLGLSSFETSIKQKGLVGTLQDVREEAKKLGIPFQELFGRLEGYKFALATTGDNNAAFTAELQAMGQAAGETSAQFEERQKGLNFQLSRLKAAAQDAGITIGNALLPKLVPLIEKLNDFIKTHQGDIEKFGENLAKGFDRLSTVDFSGVIGGLKILKDVGKGVVDIFLSLPPNIQGLIVAGTAVNKLSGGLLGQGAGNILGGLVKIAFTRGNSPAAPLFVLDVGGGGAGGAGAAGGSLLGGVAKWVLGPAAAVIIGSEIAAAVNEHIIAPAANFENKQFKAVVDSGDLAQIVGGLDAIERQQKSSNVGEQVALIASNIPFIGDALGHVGPKLEEQRQVLLNQLQQMGLTRAQAEKMVAEQQAFTAKYGSGTASMLAKIEALHLPLGIGNVIAGQIRDQAAAQTAASRTQAALSAQWGGKLDLIAAKDTNVDVTVNNNVVANISAKQTSTTTTITGSIRYNGKKVPI